jgi:hypothetical protein
MSFLLDSDICSAHLRRLGPLFHRFMQHSGRLRIPRITLSDLYKSCCMAPIRPDALARYNVGRFSRGHIERLARKMSLLK